uniref:Elongation of very long chain fatty acids protein n=1 Tax=Sinocyclocheilus rhinocerous TaxID=307959 RepID=A0A673N0L5_9TELE
MCRNSVDNIIFSLSWNENSDHNLHFYPVTPLVTPVSTNSLAVLKFNIKALLIVYHFSMVCLSAYMFYEFTASSWLANEVCWWFYFSKVIELTDTVFFILRKKNNQLTFLHVYHHGTMIFNWWAGVKYVAGGQCKSFLIGLINSFVHVVMYMYYGLAALGPQMHKYLWWKHYLTSLQLLQFFIVTIHTAVNLYADCEFPDSMNIIVLGYAFSLIALFSNFYYQNYISKKTKMSPYNLYTPIPLWSLGIETLQCSSDLAKLK